MTAANGSPEAIATAPPVLVDPVPAVEGRQGSYAGIVSRTVALCVDAVVLAVAGVGTLFLLQAVVAMIEGVPFGDVSIESEWAVPIVGFQSLFYFWLSWAVFGRTVGEALAGLRVVRRDGRPVKWGRALVRVWMTPLFYVTCGIAYVWMLFDNRRRTWVDLIAGTVVVYDWRRANERPVQRDG